MGEPGPHGGAPCGLTAGMSGRSALRLSLLGGEFVAETPDGLQVAVGAGGLVGLFWVAACAALGLGVLRRRDV